MTQTGKGEKFPKVAPTCNKADGSASAGSLSGHPEVQILIHENIRALVRTLAWHHDLSPTNASVTSHSNMTFDLINN